MSSWDTFPEGLQTSNSLLCSEQHFTPATMAYSNYNNNHYMNSSHHQTQPQSYYNVSQSGSFSNFTNQENSSHGRENRSSFDVRNSTLEPTAQEFTPFTHQQNTQTNTGATKKKPQTGNRYWDNSKRNVRYGSGRTFNSSRNEYSNSRNYDRGAFNSDKAVKDSKFYRTSTTYVNDTYSSEQSRQPTTAFNSSRNEYSNSRNYDRGVFNSDKTVKDSKFYKNSTYDVKDTYSSEQSWQNNDETSCNDSTTINAKPKSQNSNKGNYQYYNNRRDFRNEKYIGKDDIYSNNETDENNDNVSQGSTNKYNYRSRDKYNENQRYQENYSNKSVYKNNSRYDNFDSEKVSVYENQRSKEKNDRNFYDRRNSGSSFERYNKSKYYDRVENSNGKGKYENGENREVRNWRKINSNGYKENGSKEDNGKSKKKQDAASQRERLEEMLNRRTLECLVCCEKIKNMDKVWSCKQCYHILHLKCIIAWAKSSNVGNEWRCPACQNVCSEVPHEYKCYCGQTTNPKNEPGIIPHGCGSMCLRKGRTCEHKCTILCHPGPCPDCNIMVAKPCGCGSTQPIVKCSTDIEIVCDSVCNKILECGIHTCKSRCHSGSCAPCDEFILQECYCGKVGRKVKCTSEHKGALKYCCEEVCEKTLTCGNHRCQEKCHNGPCNPCERDIGLIHTCPCGKSALKTLRTSCTDPIPCCDKLCKKVLNCGQPSAPHHCESSCHEGACPPCPSTTLIRCRCGHMDKEIPCRKLTTKADDARCEKKCTKKRLCGKHKCNQRCCIEIEHFCPLPCNHQLSCGQHRCERTCHSGRCPPCIETSFEELYCECGASVIYPPVPCGTKPPNCTKPCSRQRPCGHETNHTCHTGNCPPCTVLCKRWCYGHHEQRSAIPCHQLNFSCGLPCGKPMPCGRHKCVKPCHDGACPLPCKQPCVIPRPLCGHPCKSPCHDPPCPETNCKQNVPVTCLCGLQKTSKPCLELIDEYRNIEMAQLKEKMGALSSDQTVDISDLVNKKKCATLKILECNDECRILERNRRLAIGLQIRNPDLSQKLTPRYTDFMRNWAKKDPHFCQRVHDKLTELVQLAKQSKQKSRSYSFESMNRDKRHFIHEYCEHFGCESAAYDMEPNRNIVATAVKDKSWLPSMSLLEVIQRENGQRKVPGPAVLSKNSASKSETVSLKLPGRVQRPSTPPGETIDYFNYPPV